MAEAMPCVSNTGLGSEGRSGCFPTAESHGQVCPAVYTRPSGSAGATEALTGAAAGAEEAQVSRPHVTFHSCPSRPSPVPGLVSRHTGLSPVATGQPPFWLVNEHM